MKNTELGRVLPEFPRTAHLPYHPNADGGDLIVDERAAAVIFEQPVNIEEKIDGASVGMALYDDHPLIRNRDHILRKGYVKKETKAKMQFRPVWNWFYDHKELFEKLNELGPYCVYGEWCVMPHGIFYNRLPDWFVAYDIYDYDRGEFVSPLIARPWLEELGFTVPRLFHQGLLDNGYEALADWVNEPAQWSDEKVEGLYFKVYNAEHVTNRFKMVRPDFVRGRHYDADDIAKNVVVKRK